MAIRVGKGRLQLAAKTGMEANGRVPMGKASPRLVPTGSILPTFDCNRPVIVSYCGTSSTRGEVSTFRRRSRLGLEKPSTEHRD